MDIHEVIVKKNELQLEVSQIIWDKLKKFKEETGVSVKSADCSFVNVTDFGDILPVYVMGTIQFELAL